MNTETTRNANDIRNAVRQRYGQIASNFDGVSQASCCSSDDCCAPAGGFVAVQALYDAPDAARLPSQVTGLSLGCGDPVTLASLQPGETVIDLGSGGGIDCFLAARQVGPAGRVIGVDMTPAMLDRARSNARQLQAENVEFRLGEIEHLPAADNNVDVVMSNCVINLSPDKAQVFREAFRVLRPGGRLSVSDIVTRQPLPALAQQDMASWAACVSGAWVDREYAAAIEAAGFVDVVIEDKGVGAEVLGAIPGQIDMGNGSGSAEGLVYSARISAIKPEA